MALKGDRNIVQTTIDFICNDAVSEEGLILSFSTAGSGIALGDTPGAGVVTLAASASGKIPAGLVLSKVVNIDQTVRHRNFHNGEQVVGEKVCLVKKGWVVQNQTVTSPTVGATAYLTANGQNTSTLDTNGGTAATPKVGQYLSIKDEDGYCKLEMALPVI